MSGELTFICDLDGLTDPGSFGFEVEHGGETVAGFLVRHDNQVYAYLNRCPHTGSPLDWVEHQFLDADGAFIQCATHDARFVIDSGECVFGPCPGENLSKLTVAIQNEAVFLID